MMEWTVEQQYEKMILRNYMHKVLNISGNILKALKFEGGKILINGREVDVRYRLKANDVLTVKFPPEERGFYMQPEDIPLSIVYEDEHILVLDKQPGIVVMPNPHEPGGTIANGLIAYYDKNKLPYTVHIVTRLDRDTSGLMLVAKHRYSHSLLAQEQMKGAIHRSYQAIVYGKLAKKKDTIDMPIGRKPGSFMKREVTSDGRDAITHYQVLKEEEEFSLVQVVLETGRTHQIRVHFSTIGHPIIGDELYGSSRANISRQALHCEKLQFNHPISGKELQFQCPLPEDMKKLLKK